mmetsp:Transcript_15797/g.40081  ORF Transcript_15797/g.40081 Transcript_15797/m.40081 type:complete len:253 (+) Transcript_15797:779-1537(+)
MSLPISSLVTRSFMCCMATSSSCGSMAPEWSVSNWSKVALILATSSYMVAPCMSPMCSSSLLRALRVSSAVKRWSIVCSTAPPRWNRWRRRWRRRFSTSVSGSSARVWWSRPSSRRSMGDGNWPRADHITCSASLLTPVCWSQTVCPWCHQRLASPPSSATCTLAPVHPGRSTGMTNLHCSIACLSSHRNSGLAAYPSVSRATTQVAPFIPSERIPSSPGSLRIQQTRSDTSSTRWRMLSAHASSLALSPTA